MANVKNFSSVELNDNQKRALCLGQGFAVSKPFHLGNFLKDWNKFKNKIRWRTFFLNDNITVLIQDKSKQLVVIDTEEYEFKMESILQDRSQYCQVEIDPSQEFKSKVIDWANQYLSKGDIDDVTLIRNQVMHMD